MAARQAIDVAFHADAIGRWDENQAEDFDCAGCDGQWWEETCRPEGQLLHLQGCQIAEE